MTRCANYKLYPATITDYSLIQNMWLFYVYEMGRECGFNPGWECPADLSFVPDDLTIYFTDSTRRVFLIRIGDKPAGFVLLNQEGMSPDTMWNMAEFFILAKFQGNGMGARVAQEIWKMYPAHWEVSVIPENKSALAFWRRVISKLTVGNYAEVIKKVDYDEHQPKRYILSFDTEICKPVNFHLSFESNPLPEDIQVLGDAIMEQAQEKRGFEPLDFFAFFIRDAHNTIVGGCNGSTLYGCLYIDQLWVSDSLRNQGFGTKLIDAALQYGKEKGCTFAAVNTMDWEALGFYQKLGFIVEFERHGFLKDSVFYFLRKELSFSSEI